MSSCHAPLLRTACAKKGVKLRAHSSSQNKKPTHFFDFTDVPEKGPFRCSSFREYKNVKMHRYRNNASRKGYPGWATQCVTQHSKAL
ncbi:hypothetical protein, partial [Salmonella enterica]|uniref:hypothetical protein n=1 Tax=Salmonella enterica TaxID=28901 RepID=UPI001ED9B257